MMAIGFSSVIRACTGVAFFVACLAGTVLPAQAQDSITLHTGSVVSCQITGISGDQVAINLPGPNGGVVKSVIYLSDIQSVAMAPPAEVTQLQGAAPATVVATLQPLLKQYAGLPANWVIDAMAQLADAYDSEGQAEKAASTYAEINTYYPHSPFQSAASAGIASLDLKAGKIQDALNLILPVIQKANQNLAPSPAEGRLYARAFLVYGQILQAQKQDDKALEAYLSVKTMFYQDPAQVDEAAKLVAALQQQDPSVSVD